MYSDALSTAEGDVQEMAEKPGWAGPIVISTSTINALTGE